jgi:hypothetical protein
VSRSKAKKKERHQVGLWTTTERTNRSTKRVLDKCTRADHRRAVAGGDHIQKSTSTLHSIDRRIGRRALVAENRAEAVRRERGRER